MRRARPEPPAEFPESLPTNWDRARSGSGAAGDAPKPALALAPPVGPAHACAWGPNPLQRPAVACAVNPVTSPVAVPLVPEGLDRHVPLNLSFSGRPSRASPRAQSLHIVIGVAHDVHLAASLLRPLPRQLRRIVSASSRQRCTIRRAGHRAASTRPCAVRWDATASRASAPRPPKPIDSTHGLDDLVLQRRHPAVACRPPVHAGVRTGAGCRAQVRSRASTIRASARNAHCSDPAATAVSPLGSSAPCPLLARWLGSASVPCFGSPALGSTDSVRPSCRSDRSSPATAPCLPFAAPTHQGEDLPGPDDDLRTCLGSQTPWSPTASCHDGTVGVAFDEDHLPDPRSAITDARGHLRTRSGYSFSPPIDRRTRRSPPAPLPHRRGRSAALQLNASDRDRPHRPAWQGGGADPGNLRLCGAHHRHRHAQGRSPREPAATLRRDR